MNNTKNQKLENAVLTLEFILPILEKYNFRWVIAGGFASLAYGVDRPVTDIDIDIDVSRHAPNFRNFLKDGDIEQLITQPLEHFVDQNYDNYNVELTYHGQIIDICPMAELLIFNQKSKKYENFYNNGFPNSELVDFSGLKLPLLSKELIIKNKEMLIWQRESDHKDIAGLRELINKDHRQMGLSHKVNNLANS